MKEVPVHYYEMWNMSIAQLWGKSPKVKMICGECSRTFSRRFEPIDFRNGHPRAICPSCRTINRVPIEVVE